MFAGSMNVVTGMVVLVAALVGLLLGWATRSPVAGAVVMAVGLMVALSPRIIRQWERGVLLRLGRFRRVAEPGIVWVAPGLDRFARIVDMRIRSTPFRAEKALTRDTVPVNVDAVLFWAVTDAKRAVLELEDFEPTVSWVCQTTLRDVIGRTDLGRMISDREMLDQELRETIDAKTKDWGVLVKSVEIRDVNIPDALEDAMSRTAQAEREKAARVTLAEAEQEVARQMQEAARVYETLPTAMHLRAMNMTYESIKERGALMVVPSGMADAVNTGPLGLVGAGFRYVAGQGAASEGGAGADGDEADGVKGP